MGLTYRDGMSEELSKRIDDVHKRLDDFRADVNQRFLELREDVNRRFDDVNRRFDEMAAELRELRAELRELRADTRAHFRWTVTTMIALFGLAVPIWMWFLSLILKSSLSRTPSPRWNFLDTAPPCADRIGERIERLAWHPT